MAEIGHFGISGEERSFDNSGGYATMEKVKKKIFLSFLISFLCAGIIFSRPFIDTVSRAGKGEKSLEEVEKEIERISQRRLPQQFNQKKDGYKALHLLMTIPDSNRAVEKMLQKYSAADKSGCRELVNFPFPSSFQKNTKDSFLCPSPLLFAVHRGNYALAEILLRYGADVKNVSAAYIDMYGEKWEMSDYSPVLAVPKSAGGLSVIKLLIESGCDVSGGCSKHSSSKRIEGYSPLFKSIEEADIDFFNLVYGKSDYESQRLKISDGRNSAVYTPLQYAIIGSEISEGIVDTLIDSERIFEEFADRDYRTCSDIILERTDISKKLRDRVEQIDSEVRIFRAIEKCDYNELHAILEGGRNPDVYKADKSALEWAVLKAMETGCGSEIKKIIIELLEYGAGKNKQILPYVAEALNKSANFEILDFFLSDEIQSLSIQNKPSVDSALKGGEHNNWTSLCIAIKNDNPELVLYLKEKGANINQAVYQDANNVFTPLGLACMLGMEGCAETLLSSGASVLPLQTAFGASKVTVLMIACGTMTWDVVERILSSSPESINKSDSLGRNAFMYAAQYNKNHDVSAVQKVMRNLRGRKADVSRKTAGGENALSLAIQSGQDIKNVLWLLSNGVPFAKKFSGDELEIYRDIDAAGLELLNKLNSEL